MSKTSISLTDCSRTDTTGHNTLFPPLQFPLCFLLGWTSQALDVARMRISIEHCACNSIANVQLQRSMLARKLHPGTYIRRTTAPVRTCRQTIATHCGITLCLRSHCNLVLKSLCSFGSPAWWIPIHIRARTYAIRPSKSPPLQRIPAPVAINFTYTQLNIRRRLVNLTRCQQHYTPLRWCK